MGIIVVGFVFLLLVGVIIIVVVAVSSGINKDKKEDPMIAVRTKEKK